MTPRQGRLGANLFTAAIVASVGIALAGMTWRLLGDPGTRLGATPVAARAAPLPDIATLISLSPFGTAAPVAGADGGEAVHAQHRLEQFPHTVRRQRGGRGDVDGAAHLRIQYECAAGQA
jgi:hypothetical protein